MYFLLDNKKDKIYAFSIDDGETLQFNFGNKKYFINRSE